MFKLLFGILLGAGVVYWLFETNAGRQRREMAQEKLGMATDSIHERAEDVMQTGREKVDEARDRARGTFEDARAKAHKMTDETRARAESTLGGSRSENER